MKVKDKVIVVTGAGNGIGRELSLLLLKKQANIVGVDLSLEGLLETQKIAGLGEDRFKGIVIDITDFDKVNALPKEVIHHFGAVDGIINNAGIIQKFTMVNDLSIQEIQRVVNVNFYGTLYMTKAFLPFLLERPEAHVVNISSMGGFIPFPSQTIYGAAKAAVKILTEGLYAELKDTNVKVTVVHPGAIATNIMSNSGLENPKIDLQSANPKSNMTLAASQAAEIIVDAIEKNKFRATVGKDATFLDLFYRINPRVATNFIGKMMKKSLSNM